MLEEPLLVDVEFLRAVAGQNPHDLIDAFRRSSPALLAQMEQACRQRDHHMLYRAGHTFISAANCVGGKALAEHCKKLIEERAAEHWPPLVERLQGLYAQTLDALARLPSEGIVFEDDGSPETERPHTVLLLEDNKLTRSVVHLALDRHYRVVETESSDDALAICEADQPAVALVDLNLGFSERGDRSGLAVIQRIKDRLPVVVLTVDDSLPTIRTAIRAGAWHYLIKQPSPRQLIAACEASIVRFQERHAAKGASDNLELATGWFMATYHLPYREARVLIKSVATAQRRRVADVVKSVLEWHAMDSSVRQTADRIFRPSDGPPP